MFVFEFSRAGRVVPSVTVKGLSIDMYVNRLSITYIPYIVKGLSIDMYVNRFLKL
jgi:hypothetical protein